MTVDKKELGHCLKDARKSAGFTQEKLAEKVGMSPAAISKIERGLTLPSLDNFIGIVNALGISADEILDQVNHKTYRLKLSFLTERFYRLQHRDQMKILKVVEFLVDNHLILPVGNHDLTADKRDPSRVTDRQPPFAFSIRHVFRGEGKGAVLFT